MERDFIDADAMYESRFERDETFDDFDCEVSCEEFYAMEEYRDEEEREAADDAAEEGYL